VQTLQEGSNVRLEKTA